LRNARGRYWLVDAASLTHDEDEAFERVSRSDFDSVRTGGARARSRRRVGEARALRARERQRGRDGRRREPGTIRLQVEQDARHVLVLAQARYPGWRARIDGEERTLLRANYAFQALEVPAEPTRSSSPTRPGRGTPECWSARELARLGLSILSFAEIARRRASLASAQARQ
jgi:hypothetical protein